MAITLQEVLEVFKFLYDSERKALVESEKLSKKHFKLLHCGAQIGQGDFIYIWLFGRFSKTNLRIAS